MLITATCSPNGYTGEPPWWTPCQVWSNSNNIKSPNNKIPEQVDKRWTCLDRVHCLSQSYRTGNMQQTQVVHGRGWSLTFLSCVKWSSMLNTWFQYDSNWLTCLSSCRRASFIFFNCSRLGASSPIRSKQRWANEMAGFPKCWQSSQLREQKHK